MHTSPSCASGKHVDGMKTSLGTAGLQARAQCAVDSPHRLLFESLEHRASRVPIDAERAFLETLEGGCTVPLAAHAILESDGLWVRGLVGVPDGTQLVRAERRGPASRAHALGRELAEELLQRGARAILDAHAGARSGV